MKTVEETRRELFESWFTETYTAHKLSPRQTNCGILTDGYADSRVDLCWKGFNAAIDAVEIELPSCFDTFGEYSKEAARIATECCAEAIESTSLGIKVK